MNCPFCGKQANKKNTHYLTDFIIRKSFNPIGNNEREKGLFFNFSNDTGEIEFGIQRSTSIEEIEGVFKRELTDEEIKDFGGLKYSVDNAWCKECEDIFSEIENDFHDKVLPKFRDVGVFEINEVEIKDVRIVRMFIYIQILRSAICGKIALQLETINELRSFLHNYKTMPINVLTKYPVIFTYLETKENPTLNAVGYTNDRCPFIILMSDFVIQFYENQMKIPLLDFYGLNNVQADKRFVNVNESIFKVKIISDIKRKDFQLKVAVWPKFHKMKDMILEALNSTWRSKYGKKPVEPKTIQAFLEFILIRTKGNLFLIKANNLKMYAEHFLSNY